MPSLIASISWSIVIDMIPLECISSARRSEPYTDLSSVLQAGAWHAGHPMGRQLHGCVGWHTRSPISMWLKSEGFHARLMKTGWSGYIFLPNTHSGQTCIVGIEDDWTHTLIIWELISQLHRTSVTQGGLAEILLCNSGPLYKVHLWAPIPQEFSGSSFLLFV